MHCSDYGSIALQAVHVEGPDRLIGQIVPVRIEVANKMSLAGVLEMETA